MTLLELKQNWTFQVMGAYWGVDETTASRALRPVRLWLPRFGVLSHFVVLATCMVPMNDRMVDGLMPVSFVESGLGKTGVVIDGRDIIVQTLRMEGLGAICTLASPTLRHFAGPWASTPRGCRVLVFLLSTAGAPRPCTAPSTGRASTSFRPSISCSLVKGMPASLGLFPR